jgi:hypothetical protein
LLPADRLTERREHGAIEPLRIGEIPGAKMDVIDQAADLEFSHRLLRN